jgi:hypothetical protein
MNPRFYRFESRAEFVAAALAAGWREVEGELFAGDGVAASEVGALIATPSVDGKGRPVPGALLDARWHVNILWPEDPAPAFAAAEVSPASPSRVFALPVPEEVQEPSVPAEVAAWKGKAVLAAMGLLEAAEAAVVAAGGVTEIAWRGAGTWHRHSKRVAAMAAALGLKRKQVDQMFRAASEIEE